MPRPSLRQNSGHWKTPSPLNPVREATLFRQSRIKRSVDCKSFVYFVLSVVPSVPISLIGEIPNS